MNPIDLRVQQRIAWVTIARPERMNALTDRMVMDLGDAVASAAKESAVRAVVITGTGRAFCAGADVSTFTARGDEIDDLARMPLEQRLREHFNPAILKIVTAEKPVIAAVNGVAAGMGMSLALACDLRIAARSSRFVVAFSRVGLAPDCGASVLLSAALGRSRALESVLLDRTFTADELRELGAVQSVVEDGETASAATALADRIAAGPALAFALTKRAFTDTMVADLREALEREAVIQGILSRSEDHREGVNAFIERRRPRFLD